MRIIIIFIFIIFIIYFINKALKVESYKNEVVNEVVNVGWINEYFDKVVVITLPNRKDHIVSAMTNIKISPEIFDAINKDEINIDELKKQGIVSKDYNLYKGKLACHLSHLSVIKAFLDDPNTDNILIFEDDILDNKGKDLHKIKNTIHNVMTTIPNDWDLIYFGKCWDFCNLSEKINEYVNKSYPLCRHAYAVSKQGAQKILNYSFPIQREGDLSIRDLSLQKKLNYSFPIQREEDISIRDLSRKGLINIYTSNPTIFFQDRAKLGTNLQNHSTKLPMCDNDNKKEQKAVSNLIKISIFILNYNRPSNITKQLDFFSKYNFVDEIIVSNGSRDFAISKKEVSKYPKTKIIDDFENNDILKAGRRWIGIVNNCKNDIIINMDDDLIPSEKLLYDLVYNVIRNPIAIYGPLKRLCDKSGYKTNPSVNHYNTILTPILISSKKVFQSYFENQLENDIPILIKNKGNGEDLLFNRYLIKEGIPRIYIEGKYEKLDTSNGYSSLENHYKVRGELCKSIF